MARDDRALLESIAVDMVVLSMEYASENIEAEAWEQVKDLTDMELVDFITA